MIQKPRGTLDYLPEKAELWQYLEQRASNWFERYGYRRIITPTFESTDLFVRSIGSSTDIVQKEMYTFDDKKGRSLTLKPEGTAPIVRAYLENHLDQMAKPVKLYYIAPMFRYERPQAGRYREFYQMGVEAIGSSDPSLDAETVHLFISYLDDLGLTGLELLINSMGCREDRARFTKELRTFLDGTKLCKTCTQRTEMNPLRVFDCKNESCKKSLEKSPKLLDYICDRCRKHFEIVQSYLKELGVNYQVNPNLVRGFDYYTKTTFEVVSSSLGAQDALGGGGRYDYLIEDYGGNKTPAIGFAFGLERIELALKKQNISVAEHIPLKAFIVYYNEDAKKVAFKAMSKLREEGLSVDMDFESKSFKAQLKQADKKVVPYVIIIGPEEIEKNEYILKDMKAGEQSHLRFEKIAEHLKKGNGK